MPEWKLPAFTPPQWLTGLLRHPATSYIAILLLQLKVMWGIWWYREIDVGDTNGYFQNAAEIVHDGRVALAQSPLYTTFLAAMMRVFHDAYVLTTLHRLIIMFALAVLILALMRHLLPPAMAWLATAWWVVLPINFDAIYEVHLFAVIPLLVAVMCVVWKPDPWGRGIAIAVLLVAAALIRNENFLAALCFLIASLAWDLYRWRRREVRLGTLAAAYGTPFLAAILVGWIYWEHRNPWGLAGSMRDKQEASVCVAVAYSYMQRMGGWHFPISPFGGCHYAMQYLFGVAKPSVVDMFRTNPTALLQHLWWNFRLIPAGLQVLLFNFRSGSVDPDFITSKQSWLALPPTLAVLAVLAAGFAIAIRDRKKWWNTWLKQRFWAWLLLACLSVTVFAVALMNRPRPSYMFVLGIVLRAMVLTSLLIVASRAHRLGRYFHLLGAALVLLVLIAPSVYQQTPAQRPILRDYRNMKPFAALFHRDPSTVFLATSDPYVLIAHVGQCYCPGVAFYEVREKAKTEEAFADDVTARKVTLIFANKEMLADPIGAGFVAHADQHGWKQVAASRNNSDPWALLERKSY